MADTNPDFVKALRNVDYFAEQASGLRLRAYQVAPARAIAESVLYRKGMTFVVMFPRQSGKNELQAQLETYLLISLAFTNQEIVKVSPTWKPQSLNAMRRLERVIKRNLFARYIRWKKTSGYIFQVGSATITFLSGSPTSSVVGATASLLLECDEAQDVGIEKWDKEFAPMAASTNATRVFWGTAWTSRTLLARELRAALAAQEQDGQQRVFIMDADQVAQEVPAYGAFVRDQVARMGRNHPFIRTQYYAEEIDSEGALFDARRLALMRGEHAACEQPVAGRAYAFLLDIAGEEEAEGLSVVEAQLNKSRDSTALTVVEIDLSSLEDELIQAPTYRVVNRLEWVGVKHTKIYGLVKAMVQQWDPAYLVIDATGVGAGLASFLEKAYPHKVIQFVFSPKSKSDLGWNFLAVIETGRYKEYSQADKNEAHGRLANLQRVFFQQAAACQQQVMEGPGKTLRWGVPDGTRDQNTGELVHDDLLISAAMCSVLDDKDFGLAESEVIQSHDPLAGMKDVY
ncbi:MAG TPA: hypothetical protein VLA49_06870 [Anaerolineales bacterium]|nr:hypothetical protein [Anaerolineales bacterium]